jgi:hypothetical protein
MAGLRSLHPTQRARSGTAEEPQPRGPTAAHVDLARVLCALREGVGEEPVTGPRSQAGLLISGGTHPALVLPPRSQHTSGRHVWIYRRCITFLAPIT